MRSCTLSAISIQINSNYLIIRVYSATVVGNPGSTNTTAPAWNAYSTIAIQYALRDILNNKLLLNLFVVLNGSTIHRRQSQRVLEDEIYSHFMRYLMTVVRILYFHGLNYT